MIEGWLLDVHENETNTGMVAWIVDDFGTAQGCVLPWKPTIHVHASHRSLDRMEHWLTQPELRHRFGIGPLLTTSPFEFGGRGTCRCSRHHFTLLPTHTCTCGTH